MPQKVRVFFSMARQLPLALFSNILYNLAKHFLKNRDLIMPLSPLNSSPSVSSLSAPASLPPPTLVQKTYLKDYTPPTHFIPELHLTFYLDEEKTRVVNAMRIVKNPFYKNSTPPLVLNGEHLKLLSLELNGVPVTDYTLKENSLTLHLQEDEVLLKVETEISPKENTALEGLYKSEEMLCTQNEPHGFRRITYFLDRSDVMSRYTVRLEGDKKRYPYLLSNGNLVEAGDLDQGRHFALWEDPSLKPCYLFALVAGDFALVESDFKTMSGRSVCCRVYADKGMEKRCLFALEALKRAMRWDEEVYGREYDLDLYMIVAVSSFNMGAMENKGLNIFNISRVLGDTAVSTDDDMMHVESVVAHEYFHNWTGNRITCRDWFQLTLKEGLTVFRDQEFSSDMHSRVVKRIQDVSFLRAYQFTEDAGPRAHPIRPDSFIEVNNFYTTTVYNKGAEVIRSLRILLGEKCFMQGMERFFTQFDGQAITVEDFLSAMATASGRDLTLFKRWYTQKGTPKVQVKGQYEQDQRRFTLLLRQDQDPPLQIPLAVALLDPSSGSILASRLCILEQKEQEFLFEGVGVTPILSLNRHFSVPVKIDYKRSSGEYALLMRLESDSFNRFDAKEEFALSEMQRFVANLKEGSRLALSSEYLDAVRAILSDAKLDPLLKAELLAIPPLSALEQREEILSIEENVEARKRMIGLIGRALFDDFLELYQQLSMHTSPRFEKELVAYRALKNRLLMFLMETGEREAILLAKKQFFGSQSMTDRYAALLLLARSASSEREEVLASFYKEFKDDLYVLPKWFSVQAASDLPSTLEEVKRLRQDPTFSLCIPNLTRALFGAFAHNTPIFHKRGGEGYRLLKEVILELDGLNPQGAATLANAFQKLRKLDKERQEKMGGELQEMLKAPKLSVHLYEVVSSILNNGN